MPVVSIVGWQFFFSAIPIAVGAMLWNPFPDVTNLSRVVIFSALYVYVLPMVFCTWAYFKVLGIFPATIASIGTLMIPVIGMFSSAVVLSEKVGFQELAAMVLICLALAFVLLFPNLQKQKYKV